MFTIKASVAHPFDEEIEIHGYNAPWENWTNVVGVYVYDIEGSPCFPQHYKSKNNILD